MSNELSNQVAMRQTFGPYYARKLITLSGYQSITTTYFANPGLAESVNVTQ